MDNKLYAHKTGAWVLSGFTWKNPCKQPRSTVSKNLNWFYSEVSN